MNFRFLQIPVHIHPTFWIFLLFFTNLYRDFSIYSCILGLVLIMSLLVHEYGHALTALYFGARPSITLEAFGGRAQYNAFGLTPKQQFFITLNGPLLESLLIVVSYGLLQCEIFDNAYMRYFLYATMRLNILWCLLNLIPLSPLDGGYLCRYLLEIKFGHRGQKASVFIGVLCACIAVPYLFYQGYFFFAALLLIFGLQHVQFFRMIKRPSNTISPFKAYVKSQEAIKNQDVQQGKAILKKLLKSKDASIQVSALESLAKLYVQENASDQAYALLLKADPQSLKEGKCLLCKLAFERKNYALVGKYSRDIYAIDPSFETALLNSQAFAHLNQPALSGAWLQTASQFGSHNLSVIKDLLEHPMYALVKEHQAFQQFADGKL
jgi:stage IV sporulation protein FB